MDQRARGWREVNGGVGVTAARPESAVPDGNAEGGRVRALASIAQCFTNPRTVDVPVHRKSAPRVTRGCRANLPLASGARRKAVPLDVALRAVPPWATYGTVHLGIRYRKTAFKRCEVEGRTLLSFTASAITTTCE